MNDAIAQLVGPERLERIAKGKRKKAKGKMNSRRPVNSDVMPTGGGSIMHEKALGRNASRAIGIGACAGAVLSAWNLIGMYSTIPVATWDVVRQVLFLAALAVICAVAAQAARAGGSWGITGLFATFAAVACATTVLCTYALSTAFWTARIRQVPEFILDYTHNGYTSPATYFADHYWALLELQVFVWVIGVIGLAAAGTVLGRAAASIVPHRAA